MRVKAQKKRASQVNCELTFLLFFSIEGDTLKHPLEKRQMENTERCF
jgi:hypothetical protein